MYRFTVYLCTKNNKSKQTQTMNALPNHNPFHPETYRAFADLLGVEPIKRPTFFEATQKLVDLSILLQAETQEKVNDNIFFYLVSSNLQPINDLDELTNSFFDRVVSYEMAGEYLKRASEYFGAAPTKSEYDAWIEDENQRSLYFGGQA